MRSDGGWTGSGHYMERRIQRLLGDTLKGIYKLDVAHEWKEELRINSRALA